MAKKSDVLKIGTKELKALEQEFGIESDQLKTIIEDSFNKVFQKSHPDILYTRCELSQPKGLIKIIELKPIAFDDEGNPTEFEDLDQIKVGKSTFSNRDLAQVRKNLRNETGDAQAGYVFEEYKKKERTVISGLVQQVVDTKFVDGVKTEEISENLKVKLASGFEAYLGKIEQIPGEELKHGDYTKVFVLSVERDRLGPNIKVSRTHPGLIRGLFLREVPELQKNLIEITSIAREPGERSKVAVLSKDENINGVAALIGELGKRVRAVIEDLGEEKIDIVQYSPKPEVFIANALSPAVPTKVEIKDTIHQVATAYVPSNILSLAIGKDGQNVRLAAKLTGWKIDVEEV